MLSTPARPDPLVDAHLHVWDLDLGDYPWLTPAHGALHASFTAEQARRELREAGVDRAVLVQAEDTLRDTRYLIDVAAQEDWVAGVVGWVRLDDPVAAERDLDAWQQDPAFRGVRHLVHDDPREDFLELSTVRSSLRTLAGRGIPLDVPDAWPRHLWAVDELAAAIPDLTIVIDHLAKPPRGHADLARWRAALAATARHPNTVAKVSGLHVPGQPYTVDALREVWETALELFEPRRLMYGGDWPITVTAGGYQHTWSVLSALIDELADDERAMLRSGTATATYGLARMRGGGPDAAR